VIAIAPGSPVWNLAHHATWVTGAIIVLTGACAIATPILLLLVWLKPPGLRCIFAVGFALIFVVLARRGIAAFSFVPRPFVAHHFQPLYPHASDTSFPSATTGYFAAVAVPLIYSWRRLGWAVVAITLEVAFGCVYVGVHYVTDVAAGATIGGACGLVAWWIFGYPPIARAVRKIDSILREAHLRRSTTTVVVPD
jgi:undecaprenyl-diphosphatase